MIKINRVSSLRSAVQAARNEKKHIGFVPTMGNLHEGHLELVRIAKSRCEFVVVSIYVNPTQFGENEDLDAYPSTPDEDARQLAELDVDVLFLPSQEVMYPGDLNSQTVVYVPKLGELYCGKNRPEHFNGVTTVVSRLFNMVAPNIAVFGMKDYQQLTIIKQMVRDLAYPVQVVGVDTVRNEQGLALSSRNGYLSELELKSASELRNTLVSIAEQIEELDGRSGLNKTQIEKLRRNAKARLKRVGFEPHYVDICDQATLLAPKFEKKSASGDSPQADLNWVVLAAAVLGKARLIDNIEVNIKRKRKAVTQVS